MQRWHRSFFQPVIYVFQCFTTSTLIFHMSQNFRMKLDVCVALATFVLWNLTNGIIARATVISLVGAQKTTLYPDHIFLPPNSTWSSEPFRIVCSVCPITRICRRPAHWVACHTVLFCVTWIMLHLPIYNLYSETNEHSWMELQHLEFLVLHL